MSGALRWASPATITNDRIHLKLFILGDIEVLTASHGPSFMQVLVWALIEDLLLLLICSLISLVHGRVRVFLVILSFHHIDVRVGWFAIYVSWANSEPLLYELIWIIGAEHSSLSHHLSLNSPARILVHKVVLGACMADAPFHGRGVVSGCRLV